MGTRKPPEDYEELAEKKLSPGWFSLKSFFFLAPDGGEKCLSRDENRDSAKLEA